ncbi:MAG TPA: DUF1289 domain-containing protein [Burkholderiales bacterium]
MNGEAPESAAPGPEQPAPEPVPNFAPCIGVCMLDESGYCIGCGRTAAEVSDLPPEPSEH